MDCRPVVAAEQVAGGAQIDHAIFSSLRTPMARGYRIVAASAGLSAEEKAEIVQRAPSHGNLEEAGEQATGLAGFSLQSGRYCLMLARHAGPEPSGRGGFRVYTDVLALAPGLYRRFACHPCAVAAFVRPFMENTAGKNVTALPRINVRAEVDAQNKSIAGVVAPAQVDSALWLVHNVLAGCAVLIQGTPDPAAAVNWLFDAIPAGLRSGVSCAGGMKLSTSRTFKVLFCGGASLELTAFARDHDYTVFDWSAPPPLLPGTPFAAWLEFVRRNWTAKPPVSLRNVTDRLVHDCTPDALARAAALASEQTSTPTDTGPTDSGPTHSTR